MQLLSKSVTDRLFRTLLGETECSRAPILSLIVLEGETSRYTLLLLLKLRESDFPLYLRKSFDESSRSDVLICRTVLARCV